MTPDKQGPTVGGTQDRFERRVGAVAAAAGILTLLIAASGPHPSFFQFVRPVVATCLAVMLAATWDKSSLWAWLFPLVVLIILFNPFVPVELARSTWSVIDLAAAGLLAGWILSWLSLTPTDEPSQAVAAAPVLQTPPAGTSARSNAVLGAADQAIAARPSKDWASELRAKFARHQVRLFHYTERRNLPSIRQHGLLSVAEMKRRAIAPAGGNPETRARDAGRGYGDYVHLYFARDQPAFYRREQRGLVQELVVLEVDPRVAEWQSTLFSDRNATHHAAFIDGGRVAFGRIDFALFQRRWLPHEKGAYQAEVLVTGSIPPELISESSL